VVANAGGIPMTIQLVGLTYSVQADCSVLATYSMNIKELGVTKASRRVAQRKQRPAWRSTASQAWRTPRRIVPSGSSDRTERFA